MMEDKRDTVVSSFLSNFDFYYRYFAPNLHEVTILFSWTHGMETLLYTICLFCA